MISPDDIRKKAANQYPKFVQAWLAGDSFFPKRIPANTRLSGDIVRDRHDVLALREGSKEVRGFGYSVEWSNRRLRTAGRNDVPEKIVIETQDDLLQLVGKQSEFTCLTDAVHHLRTAFPELEPWIRSHWKSLTDVAADLAGLIHVTRWFQQNTLPDCYAREIPLDVHGKFVEDHQVILRQWFDVSGVLPAAGIRCEEDNFFRRYGLRDWEPLITLRCLDQTTQDLLRLPCAEAAVPLELINSVDLSDRTIFVVENLTNVRTFPSVPDGLVIFGMGQRVVDLRFLHCLRNTTVTYWGDLDVFGLQILSTYRRLVGRARSILMDIHTLEKFGGTIPRKPYEPRSLPALLEPAEAAAFKVCNERRWQLEQERIPQSAVRAALAAVQDKIHTDR